MEDATTSPDPLGLVSSLYGPGTTGAWMLSGLALLLSWSLERKTSDDWVLSADLAAFLLIPAVAATDIFYQLSGTSEAFRGDPTDTKYSARQMALQAPFVLCHDFVGAVSLPCAFMIVANLRVGGPLLKARLAWLIPVHVYCTLAVMVAYSANSARANYQVVPLGGWSFHVGDGQHLVITIRAAEFLFHPVALFADGKLVRRFAVFSWVKNGLPHLLGTLIYYVFCCCDSVSVMIHFAMYTGLMPQSATKLGELDQTIALVGGFLVLGSSVGSIVRSWHRLLDDGETIWSVLSRRLGLLSAPSLGQQSWPAPQR
ncbi:hypothetical protein D7B24_002278 [Verticillium nonalfalfae]|uniref:Uncharacterized protein n=1 Tax=Verticillium nonalfalfae TaxID=1051616 RepID=A0A3M9XZT6_9PEZI|nr:uncharacterized protein D7B24_002278 [Verticillium nonalfalfae]RNJ53166.1 hypothetical protein D7B24_002278 [Verticillium nonalfalfae]